ncbi:LOW QUALITY PROTEIN: arf-GAP with Rho-GAP domain, ANK repeat and PH domain-containing protein 1-like [Paramacrobiotus metropolitanus]|uniref:LOW QUALITY PROTEIN: arf-GAP with Rho-GAP domain, ANK repeat and PH domain-containing protein 1-like n=1 Tax=Paramacrobiotus metropolitanus TaxID=2943436 RepID=UPI00244655A2|nr:LOW QUALITY PROTEIN: arf-GAP with Rho-GAP domain, ANK repeat and PH domain-containing protein 1-like [Paramacrobiotus metropolitanus]
MAPAILTDRYAEATNQPAAERVMLEDMSEPPALPPPRRVNRAPEDNIAYQPTHPPLTESTTLALRNIPECSSPVEKAAPIPRPRKPVPLPRFKLPSKSPLTPESSVSLHDELSSAMGSSEHLSELENLKMDNLSEHELDSFPLSEYLQPVKTDQSQSGQPTKFPYPARSVLSSTVSTPIVPSDVQQVPIHRSASNGTMASAKSLIQWESIDNLQDFHGQASGLRAVEPDVFSAVDLDLTPPAYSPPPIPKSPESGRELIPIEPPPPLPPRPLKKDGTSMDVIVERPAPPLPVAVSKTAHEREVRNGISTLCSDLLTVKFNQREQGKRWCVLKDGKISLYADRKSLISPKNVILCSEILDITVLEEKKNKLSFGFEITMIKDRSKPWTFSAVSRDMVIRWMSAIAKGICDVSGMYLTSPLVGSEEYEFGGKVFMRRGSTGEWMKIWIELQGRTLRVFTDDVLEEFDLRKTLSFNMVNVGLYENKSDAMCRDVAQESNPFILNMPGKSLHFQADTDKQTLQWMKIMQKRAKECGDSLEDQPLTADDVPVIVDKCMQFVSAYGLKSKGIYRQSGVSSKIALILEMFAKDAHSCYLSRENFTEHDVAGALKRFLRQLPEPVIKVELYQPLLHCTEMSTEVKLKMYLSLLDQLPRVPNYATLKKLLGHLKVVSESANENLMSIPNIAASFGNTLMSGNGDSEMGDVSGTKFDTTTKEITVMVDLLTFYEPLFDVKQADLDKERKILNALEAINKQLLLPPRAGDFLMGVYWIDKNGECVNMRLSSKLTAGQLCQNMLDHEKMVHDNSYSLYEVIFDDKLYRPVHYAEEVSSIIMRWTEWNSCNICEYSSNYLCVRRNTVYEKVAMMERSPLSVTQQLRFSKDKTFKKVSMDFSRMALTVHKSASVEKDLGNWKVEDIIWFLGCSPQRTPPTKWTFSFIEKDRNAVLSRLKENRVAFGFTVCCDEEEWLDKWIAAMLQAQHNMDFYSDAATFV